ncbi:MAG TPA: Dam family site-specific DNA-(adenine-N6)-methyltransferase [Vicinamibacterales bacterium]|nr:Dam family site-specific DNA-(adenine-N6)-methyltransferase [Vicinamibacterales bacterium]
MAGVTAAPPLKWAGGKRWQLRYLQPLWRPHAHRRLVEPFCGGLSVALGLMPQRALLNDINPHLINFYEWLKRGLRLDIRLEHDAEVYYAHRARFNQLLEGDGARTREAAALFYYLNRTGYNGLCRFNSRGVFNVPFGKYKRITYASDFLPYRRVVAGWEFSAQDFAVLPLASDDFVYADPPYDVQFTKYAKQGFTWDDQVRAATWLAGHPGPVVLVNQATPRVRELYGDLGFRLESIHAPRRIACTGDRTPAEEVFACRNLEQSR